MAKLELLKAMMEIDTRLFCVRRVIRSFGCYETFLQRNESFCQKHQSFIKLLKYFDLFDQANHVLRSEKIRV